MERTAPNTYEATLSRVVDGDTVYLTLHETKTLVVDFGLGISTRVAVAADVVVDVRLLGINAPELEGLQAQAGQAAKAELIRLLGLAPTIAASLSGALDKYGRRLANLYVTPPGKPQVHINQAMIDGGFAKPYSGHGPRTA